MKWNDLVLLGHLKRPDIPFCPMLKYINNKVGLHEHEHYSVFDGTCG